MASTNKTTHYELSQYIGTDKPTYLVDYNTDMANIDQGIYDAKSEADNNNTAIGTLSNLETEVKTDLVSAINEVETETNSNTSNIGNLSNLTTEATNSLVSAINEVDAEADRNNQNIGNMVNLETTVKTSLVGAINEVNSKATVGNEFSTAEVRVGTWIDGKPLYRCVISTTTATAGTEKRTDISNLNVDKLILNGFINTSTLNIPLNAYFSSSNYIFTYWNNTPNYNQIRTTVSDSIYANTELVYILEYTKTTD